MECEVGSWTLEEWINWLDSEAVHTEASALSEIQNFRCDHLLTMFGHYYLCVYVCIVDEQVKRSVWWRQQTLQIRVRWTQKSIGRQEGEWSFTAELHPALACKHSHHPSRIPYWCFHSWCILHTAYHIIPYNSIPYHTMWIWIIYFE